MTINEYQQLAQRTASTNTSGRKIKYLYQEHELDFERMAEELGDVCWYVAELAAGMGLKLEDVMARNIAKLRKRYPDGFDAERSVHREEER